MEQGPRHWDVFSMPHFLSVFKIFHSAISGVGFVLVKAEPIGKMIGASYLQASLPLTYVVVSSHILVCGRQ